MRLAILKESVLRAACHLHNLLLLLPNLTIILALPEDNAATQINSSSGSFKFKHLLHNK